MPKTKTNHQCWWIFLFFLLNNGHSITAMMTMSSKLNSNAKVAIVTGASRGIGRGIAIELGKAGYTVFAVGRSSRNRDTINEKMLQDTQRPVKGDIELTVEATAEIISSSGGVGYGMAVDLSQDGSIEKVVRDCIEIEGRLDVLVCSAFMVPVKQDLRDKFWKQGMDMWDTVNGVGLRQVYNSCYCATPHMIETAKIHNTTPLICLVSSFGGQSYTFNVAYGVGKAAIDRLAKDMAIELKDYNVATRSIYPGLVKTEANIQMELDGKWDEASGGLDLATGESTSFSGKAVVALASLNRENIMERSGEVEVVAELAKEIGFTEEDGSIPPSIRSLKYLLPNFVFPKIEKESGKPIPTWVKDNVPDYLLPWSIFSSGPPPE